MSEPKRIQRKRTKGWKAPEGAVYVGRPTKWGNPFSIGGWFMKGDFQGRSGMFSFIYTQAAEGYQDGRYTKIADAAQSVEWFRWYMAQHKRDLSALRGKTLMCWCPEGSPCHADVLLELANAPAVGAAQGEV